MTKIYVNRGKKLDGTNSNSKLLWASFKLEIDAQLFAESLKKKNPSWEISIE